MKRLTTAPNLALATLWSDMLSHAGFASSVQRTWAGSIAGEIPPDQSLPEVWVHDDAQIDAARRLLADLQRAPRRHWRCPSCGEDVDGPFEQCWNCLAPMPSSTSS